MLAGLEKTIPIACLRLNLSNPRCLLVENEDDALVEMLLEQGGDKRGNKILTLARDIAANGLHPTELLIVKPTEVSETYIVMEGNRRISAIKCMNNPELISDRFPVLSSCFEALGISPVSEVKCYVSNDDMEINRIIKAKHNGQNAGVGIVAWNSEQRSRFMERVSGKKDKTIQLIDLIIHHFGIDSNEAICISKCKKTNLDRLFGTPYVRERLGFSLANSAYIPMRTNWQAVSRMLERLSLMSVGDIYDVAKRREFIDGVMDSVGIPDENKQNKWDFSDENNAGQSSREKSLEDARGASDRSGADASPRPKGYNAKRRTVAPREGCPLSTLGRPNLSQLHTELKALSVEQSPMACSLLLRTLIELVVDEYLTRRLNSDELGQLKKYSARIQRACNELVGDSLSGIQNNDVDYFRKFAQNVDSIPVTLSSLSAVAHGISGWPDGDSLILLWDKIYKPLCAMLNTD